MVFIDAKKRLYPAILIFMITVVFTVEAFNTYVEIWVAPTTKDTQAGLLK